MKKHFLNNSDTKPDNDEKINLKLWLTIHGLIFAGLLISAIANKGLSINTNLFDILPQSNASRMVSKADAFLSSKTSRNFNILVKASDFEQADKAATLLVDRIFSEDTEKKIFEQIDYNADQNAFSEIYDFFYKYRFNLLTPETLEASRTQEGREEVRQQALFIYYSSLFSGNQNPETDPFAFGNEGVTALIKSLTEGSGSMYMKNGVLTAESDGSTYVMIRGKLTPEGAAITNSRSGIKMLYALENEVKSQFLSGGSGLHAEFIHSGVPFHSYESSSKAQKEIAIISAASIILIIILCLYVFRSLVPVIASVAAITISSGFALSSVLIIFGQIHILTFVFGTTLIGTCLDYSVHYFVRWKGDPELNTGSAIRKELFKGLSLSLLSTEICYILLFFSPFMLLRQVAVFSFTGILSSYLTALCIYPCMEVYRGKREISFLNFSKNSFPKFKKVLFLLIVVAITSCLCIFHKNIRIQNNLKDFYTMKGKLLQDEITAAKVLDHGSKGWYFIVKGATQEEVLENEAALCSELDSYVKDGKLTSYLSITKYIPSTKMQENSYRSCALYNGLLPVQFEDLGFSKEESPFLEENYVNEYESARGKYILPEGDVPAYFKDALSNLWIGEIDGKWYSAVMPMHAADTAPFIRLAKENPDWFFMNKMQDAGAQLDRLTKLMLAFTGCAFVIMSFILRFFYGGKKLLKIITIPVLVTSSCFAALGALNIPLGFFPLTGIVLVFGLGIDYIIYTTEKSDRLNEIAITVSFASSAISFCALALSSFPPVFMFGATVSAGLITAFLCTRLLTD